MSTTTSPALQLTRRGRVVLVLAFLTLALAALVAAGQWATASRSAGTGEPVRMVTVQPGETLYDIAGRIADPGEVRDTVHEIQQLNALPGSSLSVGQELAVPR